MSIPTHIRGCSVLRFLEWLEGPHLRDAEGRRGSRLVIRAALVTLAVAGGMQLKYHFEGAHEVEIIGWIGNVLLVLALALNRATGSYRVGGHLFCFAMWAIFFGIATVTGGVEAPNLVANAFLVALAPMVLGARHGLIWLGAAVFTGVAQYQMTVYGLVLHTISPEDMATVRLAEVIATCSCVALTAYFYETEKEHMRRALALEKRDLDASNADLRGILDNAGQGFLSLDREGRLSGERSAVIAAWFGAVENGVAFASLLAERDRRAGEWFEAGWVQVMEGVLPVEVCLAQLPERVVIGATTYRFEYEPVYAESEELEKVILVISDATAEVLEEQAAVRQQDLLNAFDWILRDADAFRAFLENARRDVVKIEDGTLSGAALLRCLHTLKGNAGLIGLSVLAQKCHELEDRVGDGGLAMSSVAELWQELFHIAERLGRFVAESDSKDVVLLAGEYRDFLRRLRERRPHAELESEARSWSRQLVEPHLQRLAEHTRRLSRQLGKGEISVVVDDQDVRVAKGFDDFWETLVHVVRNAVDHGLESPDERSAQGKGRATVTLRAERRGSDTAIEVSDDGRGIDWKRVAEAARKRGLPASSKAELREAVLADGVSTRDSVSTLSGRGVGMGSMRNVCEGLGIRIEVESALGAGTSFRFLLPETPATHDVRLAV